jgi:SNF2 family DNA or RNA helicase
MGFPSASELTREEFIKQVWVEMHPHYSRCLVFQNADPYFAVNHKPFGWFADDGTLFDLYTFQIVVDALSAEGYRVLVSDEAQLFVDSLFEPYEYPPSMKDFDRFRFQSFGLRYMESQPRGIFTWDTGTGKTVAGIASVARRLGDGDVEHVIIWAKSHLVKGWVGAFERFCDIPCDRMDKGGTARRKKAYGASGAPVWVINYEKVRCSDYSEIVSRLKGKRVMFVFDEVQKMKNRTSALHKHMRELIKELKVEYLIALSATPCEEGPEDYYNIFRLLHPKLFGTVKDFESRYTCGDGAKDYYFQYLGFQNLQDMRLRSAFMVNGARKSNPEIAKEFPEMFEVTVPLELSAEDAKLYVALRNYAYKDIAEGSSGAVHADAARRCCSLPETLLFMDEGIASIATQHGVEGSKHCAKLQATIDMVTDIISQGDKVIVFFRLTNYGIIPLSAHFGSFAPLLYYGEMSADQKTSVEHLFRQSPDRNLMFVSDAGREGLNLPEAAYLIHYDTPYLWSHYVQRSNRIHRIDSDKSKVTVYRFTTADTIEERVEEIMLERKGYAENLGLTDDAVLQISRSDEKYLLFGEDA